MQPHLATGTPLQAQAIAARAADGDAAALACVRQFCAWLGAVAGDLALTLGARGGVYVGGGIVPAWGTLFQDAVFRQRFEDKGRYREYLRAIPTYIITTPQPALIGLQRLLAQQRRT
jgi:glucokinase